ncbi:hypothetical protein ACSZMD_06505 [Aeromonas veronii]
MPKYYVMLINTESYQMITPVKALLNPYNGGQAYCAGMPQFFGGTDDKDQPVALVLADEINQESRRTLELTSGSPHYFSQKKICFSIVQQRVNGIILERLGARTNGK